MKNQKMKQLLMILTVFGFSSMTMAQIPISGNLSGTLGPDTYLVTGTIYVQSGQTLQIMPGTILLHEGNYSWEIDGELIVEGNAVDSVRFERQMPIDEHRWGGIRFNHGASNNSMIQYAVIDHCYHPEVPNKPGGGIYANGVSLSVTDTRISNCENSNEGGGFYAVGADIYLDKCVIVNNLAAGEENGGGIFLNNCDNSIISNSIIAHNTTTDSMGTDGGGGIRLQTSDVYLSHNLIHDNEAPLYGGGIFAYASAVELVNNTVSQNRTNVNHVNSRAGGLYAYENSQYIGMNNIIYGNEAYISPEIGGSNDLNYTCSSVSLSGTGNIVADPMFVDPMMGNFYLQENSPCIDAGDPSSPLDPDNTTADIGAFYYDQGGMMVDIILTPANPPIMIPANGGSFGFNIEAANNSSETIAFEAWTIVELPDGSMYGPLINPVNISLNSGASIDRDRNQNVPSGAPSGIYTYYAYVGVYPNTVWQNDSFEFDKSEALDGFVVSNWENTGESFSLPEENSISATPNEFALTGAYPNPFNPTTTLSYELNETSEVILKVYDVSGREVATLVNGMRAAGTHEVIFDGTHLVSGVYLYQLNTGSQTAHGKMILMK
jgi:hypothetical protein